MNDSKFIGTSSTDVKVAENQTCREIALEVSRFGINDRQRLFLIYLLSLELENSEHVHAFGDLYRELSTEKQIFLSSSDGQ